MAGTSSFLRQRAQGLNPAEAVPGRRVWRGQGRGVLRGEGSPGPGERRAFQVVWQVCGTYLLTHYTEHSVLSHEESMSDLACAMQREFCHMFITCELELTRLSNLRSCQSECRKKQIKLIFNDCDTASIRKILSSVMSPGTLRKIARSV